MPRSSATACQARISLAQMDQGPDFQGKSDAPSLVRSTPERAAQRLRRRRLGLGANPQGKLRPECLPYVTASSPSRPAVRALPAAAVVTQGRRKSIVFFAVENDKGRSAPAQDRRALTPK